VLLGASLAEFCVPQRRKALPLAMLLLFAGLWLFGVSRLAAPGAEVPGVKVRLVQPDVPQNEKYVRRYVGRNWQRLIDLSRKPGQVTHIIWPEAAPPFLLERSPVALDEIARLTAGGQSLITGSARAERSADKISFYNALYIFGPGGKVAVYDKFHLVPFGEYVPFAETLAHLGISKLTEGQEGFSAGDGPHVYHLSGAPDVTPLICYEIIFPGAVTPDVRPGWLVNVTDDSWFGPWAGPKQHLLIARARAIEEGLPVARAANTGISAMIDPYGRIISALPLDRVGVVDAALPRALAATPYARFGDMILAILLGGVTIAAFVISRKESR
jgi:apolipoprotein N-acyltransferase